MTKPKDELHDALVDIERDGILFLNADFMNQIHSAIPLDEERNPIPLEPLK